MKKVQSTLVALCAALAAGAWAATPPTPGQLQRNAQATGVMAQLTENEALGLAQTANKAEIEAGRLAARKASSGEVKGFAQHMIAEHTQSQREIAQTGAAQDSAAARALDTAASSDLRRLQGLGGKAFDRAYVDSQVNAHRTLLDRLSKATATGGNAGLLKKTIDTVSRHLQEAQRIQGSLLP